LAELPIDYEGIKVTAAKTYGTVDGFLAEQGTPGFLRPIIAGIVSGILLIGVVLIAVIVQGVLGVGTFFATSVLQLIHKVRAENPADFNQVIAASLSELLGVEISAADLPTGQGPEGINARVLAIGSKLHDLLGSEFGTGGPITPEQGAANARKFSGFAINFAVSSAFIAILSEAESFGILKEFRELGVETAQAIGLGRMVRLALQPLIRNAVQQPYDRYLKALIRPDTLSEAQVVRALQGGDIDDATARQMLAEKGYPDNLIDLLIKDLKVKIGITELARLTRYNILTEDQAIERLTAQGYPKEDALLLLKGTLAERADTQVGSILAILESARLEGFMGQAEVEANLNDLPLSVEEQRLFLKKLGIQLERARKHITFAQAKTGIVEGIVDFSFLDQWLTDQGYTDEEHLILTYEVIQALAAADAKKKAKAATAAALGKKGKPVPPPLTTP
jgi:hypothetical protein